ncbi:hypothetical protein FKW77_001840 [Venturia effusa]|uniref:rhamnogalacturonan endolyase n=1 Tax=Venturia effusa TaxID=50376 RepID=A0A517LEW1_9PEZI|nr:hypothetical protein FKW77_001840 [Venturia effusa]
MNYALLLSFFSLFCRYVIAAFGVTETAGAVQVDTGGGLTYEVNKANGDITSLLYRGTQYQAPGKGTQINSGLGASSVSTTNLDGYVITTIKSSANPVTHYYVSKKGESRLYMATINTGPIPVGELRFITRLRKSAVPNGVKHPVADIAGGTPIEGKDVYKVGSETRCKFFSSERFIDDVVHYVHGPGSYVSLILPENAYETASGGPFMRDINNQGLNDQQEMYYYMNSEHLRTEQWRSGLKGPYILDFSQKAPSNTTTTIDTSFFSKFNIPGYVSPSQRGYVSGTASGVPSKFQTVLHWFNKDYQYWAYASNGGVFKSPAMKPGTYDMVLYKQEFAVAKSSVSVTAGGVTKKDIASTESAATPIWRIGEFDGQPFEFKNGEKFTMMHPSDSRMSSWGGSYTVGSSTTKEFPMAIFAKIGGNATINFDLTSAQASSSTILRVGTTLSFSGGRPAPVIGSWTSTPPLPQDMQERGITRGGYRGYGEIYEFKIPSGTLKAGKNTLILGVAGKGAVDYLSANYIVDAIELVDPKGGTTTTPVTSGSGDFSLASGTSTTHNEVHREKLPALQ